MAGQIPRVGNKRRSIHSADADSEASISTSTSKRQAQQTPDRIATAPAPSLSTCLPHRPGLPTPLSPFPLYAAQALQSTPSSTTEYSWTSSTGESSTESTPIVGEFDESQQFRHWGFSAPPFPANFYQGRLYSGASSHHFPQFIPQLQDASQQVVPQHEQYQWSDLAEDNFHYDPTVPCTDPSCDDGVPCPDLNTICNSDVCLDEGCELDPCYDEECPEQSNLPSPCQEQGEFCFNKHCDLPTCDTLQDAFQQPVCWDESCQADQQCTLPCVETHQPSSPLVEAHRNLCHNPRDPMFECVDPNCLIRNHTSLSVTAHHHIHTHSNPSFFTHLPPRTTTYDTIPQAAPEGLVGLREEVSPDDDDDDDDEDNIKYEHTLHESSEEPCSPDTAARRCQWSVGRAGKGQTDEICGKIFFTAEQLHQHVEKAHIEGLPREESECHGFYCHWSGCDRFMCRSFQARPKLKRHMQTHTLYKPFVCSKCGVQMKTKDAMEKHERTHSGERPYICKHPGCQKVFATSTELKTHMVVHSGLKPHKCPICNESFADSSNLSKHKKTHFVGMYKCPECGARMKRWDQMRRHIVTQKHASNLLTNKVAQQEYKAKMEREFKELPEEERMLEMPDKFSEWSSSEA